MKNNVKNLESSYILAEESGMTEKHIMSIEMKKKSYHISKPEKWLEMKRNEERKKRENSESRKQTEKPPKSMARRRGSRRRNGELKAKA